MDALAFHTSTFNETVGEYGKAGKQTAARQKFKAGRRKGRNEFHPPPSTLPALNSCPCAFLPFCLDCISLSGDVDLDRSRLGVLAQRNPHGEDAVLVLGRDPIRVDGLRQRERAAERPVAPLDVVVLIVLDLDRRLLLAADGQDEVLDVDTDVVA